MRLLRAASEIVGGDEALALRLNLRRALLNKLMSGRYALPPQVLLQAMDIILVERESRGSSARQPTQGPESDA